MVRPNGIYGNYPFIASLTVSSGQPQFLNQDRYDKLVRTPLLKQSVETEVARRIESIYDAGVGRFCRPLTNCDRDGRLYS